MADVDAGCHGAHDGVKRIHDLLINAGRSGPMKLPPILFAVAVAAAAALRWRRLSRPLRLASVGLCAGLAVYGAGIFELPRFEAIVAAIGSTLGPYSYALVAMMAFLETGAFVGLVVPGEMVVVAGGVVAGQGHVDLLALVFLTWASALFGDLTGYLLGRRLGRRFLLEHGARVQITEGRLRRVEQFFARYGPATILVGRFIGLVRPVAPFLAGASRYPARRFAALAVIGTGIWSGAFVLLGFVFWRSLDEAIAIAKQGTLVLGGTAFLAACGIAAHRHLRARAARQAA